MNRASGFICGSPHGLPSGLFVSPTIMPVTMKVTPPPSWRRRLDANDGPAEHAPATTYLKATAHTSGASKGIWSDLSFTSAATSSSFKSTSSSFKSGSASQLKEPTAFKPARRASLGASTVFEATARSGFDPSRVPRRHSLANGLAVQTPDELVTRGLSGKLAALELARRSRIPKLASTTQAAVPCVA